MGKRGGKRTSSFKPGQSGNPGGRPKIAAEIKELARVYTQEAINALASILVNDGAKDSDKISAAVALLDRGYGKPTQHVQAEVSIFERMDLSERYALDEAIAVITLNAGSDQGGEPQTHH